LCLGATELTNRSDPGGTISKSRGKISVVTTAVLERLTSASFVHGLCAIVVVAPHFSPWQTAWFRARIVRSDKEYVCSGPLAGRKYIVCFTPSGDRPLAPSQKYDAPSRARWGGGALPTQPMANHHHGYKPSHGLEARWLDGMRWMLPPLRNVCATPQLQL
jgi:hypothetical protein